MYEFLFGALQFPVAPEKLQMKIKNQNKTMSLISGQEINIPASPGLTEFSFSALLPAAKYPFAVYPDGFHNPAYYLEALKELKTSKKPFRFIVNRKLPNGLYSYDTDILVLLEDYTVKDDASEVYDVTVGVNLKQYVAYGAKIIAVQEVKSSSGEIKKAAVEETPRPAKEPEKSYTVKKGDSLWTICKRELGDGAKYKEVAGLNGIKNPNLIHPGQVIRFG